MTVNAILDGAAMDAMLHGEPSDPRTYLLRFHPEAPVPPLGQIAPAAPPLAAKVNHGQWVALCDCGAPGVPAPGGVVWLALPLVWCVRCENASAGGLWRLVIVPSPRKRQMIENRLLVRPDPATRNWLPHETTRDLERENVEHGVRRVA